MRNYTDKIKILFGGRSKGQLSFEKKGIKPAHDWVTILAVIQIIVIVMIAFAFYFYIKINKGEYFVVTVDDSENEAKINNVLLNKTINDLNARAEHFSQTVSGAVIPQDPSI